MVLIHKITKALYMCLELVGDVCVVVAADDMMAEPVVSPVSRFDVA